MERLTVVPGIGRSGRVTVRPRVQVDRAKLTYLEERGWTRHGEGYRGQYKTPRGTWWGEVKPDGPNLNFFVHDPPHQVLNGPHNACFNHIGDGWWWVHFYRESPNPSDGVMEIERVLAQSA